VCLRVTDLRPGVDPLTGAVSRSTHGVGLSAADEAALERALTIAEAWSGQVLAVTAGQGIADEALRTAAALGVRVLRVAWPPVQSHPTGDGHPLGLGGGPGSGPGGGQHGARAPFGPPADYLDDLAGDTSALAAALVAAIRTVGEPALVLCGDRSADRGTGALPAQIAHLLGAAQALGLVDLRIDPAAAPGPAAAAGGDAGRGARPAAGAVSGLLGERRLDGGRRERLRIPRPAVCSAEAAGLRLRRASLPAALAANRAPVPVVETAGAAAGGRGSAGGGVTVTAARAFRPRTRVVQQPTGTTPRERLLALTGALVAHEPPTIVGPTDAATAADTLIAYLTRAGYLTPEHGGPQATDTSPTA
jgi:electron transfer flavoprotein beta subunit